MSRELIALLITAYALGSIIWWSWWDNIIRDKRRYYRPWYIRRAAKMVFLTPVWPIAIAFLGVISTTKYFQNLVRIYKKGA